ncbi:MAG: Rpn family recombination-promoting nuclease/putative transposase [Paludibacteraceae bacterium]|nr:Rpn family recombination-promoting nuclease/putative transposase [Paludibacteraceae bacterium]
MAKFIDLRCDFGFKYCMSDPIIMMSFLNAILDGDEETITDVSFENVEMPRETEDQRGVIFDLLCTTDKGDTILIEMQNSCQKFFKTRANYYVYKLLDSKIGKGLVWKDMKEDISKIIGIFIMGETMAGIDSVITRTAECDLDTGELFWDRHRKYFVNLQKFKLDGSDITMKDLWLYSFKNLGNMENIDPSVYEKADEGLLKLIERAKVGALSKKEYAMYEASLKRLADEIDMEEHGFERGVEEGKHNESLRIATDMKKKGFDFALIHELTNVSLDVIERL